MEKHKTREIELRGMLSEKEYLSLWNTLEKKGYRGEKDDKSSYFFVWNRGILKINDEISKNQTKLSLKIGDETKGSLREHEVVFPKESLQTVFDILKEIGFSKFHKVVQQRENFFLRDLGVEIALKYTEDFQHHFEIEFMGEEKKTENETKQYLAEVCRKFGIKPMGENELREKIRDIKIKHGLHEEDLVHSTGSSKGA